MNYSNGTQPAFNAQGATQAAAWEDVLGHAMASLSCGITALMNAGAVPPDEVGFEIEDDGAVVAEAELAWRKSKIVVLMPEHAYCSTIWQAKGWKPLMAEGDWETAVASELQIIPINEELAVQEMQA